MVEIDLGFSRRDSGLITPIPTEQRKLVHADIVRMFGSDYRERIRDKARAFGLSDEIQFFDEPMPHVGSQALYLAQQFMGDHLVLVPVLRPHMRTSKHHHEIPMFNEVYSHVAGESFIDAGEKRFVLNKDQDLIEVPLNVSHQVTTKESPSLTLIIMRNARLVPSGRLHIKDTE